jgi:hypothetical protein
MALILLLPACNNTKDVYITKTLKTKEEFYHRNLVKMNFYYKDTSHFMRYGFGVVELNNVPIITDSVGRQFEKELNPGKFKVGIINLGNKYKEFKIKIDRKYQYEIKVVLHPLDPPKNGIL